MAKNKKKARPDAGQNARRAVETAPPAVSKKTFSLPDLLVTLSVGIVALSMVAAQFPLGTKPRSEPTLSTLEQRAEMLQKISDPIQRDSYCIPLSAYGRALDRALDTNARVFFSGLIGRENAGALGYYYFLQNYLFPRDVEISLDGRPIFENEGYFDGIPCDSPSVLRAKGFDLMIRSGTNGLQLIPLTERGAPHE